MITSGQEWARRDNASAEVTVTSDRELAAAMGGAVVLRGGDVHRALGAPMGDPGDATVAVDLIEVRSEDITIAVAASYVLIGRAPHRLGRLVGAWHVLTNAGFIGRYELAPRAHPGDGAADLFSVDASMSLRQRVGAARRSRLGAHLPHPALRVRRVHDYVHDLQRGERVWVDGRRVPGRIASLQLRVAPEAVHVRL